MNEDILKMLTTSSEIITASIEKINNKWDIKSYPAFLKSCAMHKTSWDIMKYKYILKIANAIRTKTREQWVISFLGRFVNLLFYCFLF
jgi:hypothetical protein